MESRVATPSTSALVPDDVAELLDLLRASKIAHKTQNKITNWMEVISVSTKVPRSASLAVASHEISPTIIPILNSVIDVLLGVDDPERRRTEGAAVDVGTMVQQIVETSFHHSSDSELRGASIRVFGSAATGLQMESLNSDVDLMIQPLGKQVDSSELTTQQQLQRQINSAESNLQRSCIYTDSLADLDFILAKFRTDATTTLKSIALNEATANSAAMEAAAREEKFDRDWERDEGENDRGPALPRRDRNYRRQKKTKKKGSGAAEGLKASSQRLLEFVQQGEALLAQLSTSEDIGSLKQSTQTDVEAARGRIKRLKQEAEAAGNDSGNERSDKNYLRAVLKHLRK
jgi:predicted nucleotidyltransferase